MGTDVYLSWQQQSAEEQRRQITGYAIDAGNVGYLRASIGMTQENAVLRRLFADEFWHAEDALPFNFATTWSVMELLVQAYVLDVQFDVDQDAIVQEQEAMLAAVHAIFVDAGLASGAVALAPATDDRASRERWAASVRAFFALGLRLQRADRDPRVRISW